VTAGGTAPFSYQWLKNGTVLPDGGNVSGSQAPTLTLSNVLAGRGGYSVIITNTSGSVTSQVATLSVADPLIVMQPANLTRNSGQTAQFSVTAVGTPPLDYCWLKNGFPLADGGNITGAGTSTLMVSSVKGADAGSYRVVVSNSLGTVTSLVATLRVIIPPPIGAVTVDFEGLAGMTFFSGIRCQ